MAGLGRRARCRIRPSYTEPVTALARGFSGTGFRRIAGSAGALAALSAAVAVIALAPTCDERNGVELVIGDSLAAGNGSSNPLATSFAALVADREGVAMVNYAKSGSTTQVVIDTQLEAAEAKLREGNVRYVLISAGGNDLGGLIPNPACVESPPGPDCPLEETLAGVRERLDFIVSSLRETNARVPIVLLAVPNLFSGTGHAWEAPAGRVLPRLRDTIQQVAAGYEHIAVAEPVFLGQGDALTHINDPQFDPHPNDAGHRVIADAVESALQKARGD